MSERKSDIMKFLQSLGLSVDDKTGELKPSNMPMPDGVAINEEPKPELKYEYFIFYILSTKDGPVLGNTITCTNAPLSSKTFDSLRRGLIMDYMQDTGQKGVGEDALTIVSISRLS